MTQWLARVFEFVSADSGTPTCPRAKPPAQEDKPIPSTRKNEGADSQHGNRHHRYPPSLCLNPNPGCWGPCTSTCARQVLWTFLNAGSGDSIQEAGIPIHELGGRGQEHLAYLLDSPCCCQG